MVRLVVGVDLQPAAAVLDRTLGTVRIGRGECGANIFKTDAIFEECQRVELDPHRGQ